MTSMATTAKSAKSTPAAQTETKTGQLSLCVWCFVLANSRKGPILQAAFDNGKPFNLAERTLPSEVKTALGCNDKLVIQSFETVADIFDQRKARLPRRARHDLLSPDGRTLSICIDFND